MAGCADQVKRVTLELGGKSANIVFADADSPRPRPRRRTPPSTTPARTAARGRGSWSSGGVRRVPRPARGGGRAARRSSTPRTTARWDGWSPRGSVTRSRPTSIASRSPSQGDAPGGDGLLASAHDGRPRHRPTRTDVAREVFGPVVAVMAFDDEARAVELATTPSRASPARSSPVTSGAGCGSPVPSTRQPQRQLARLRPLLDTVRLLQAVGARPRARPRRPERAGEERVLLRREARGFEARRWRSSHLNHRKETMADVSRARSPWSPEAAPVSAWRPYAASSRRARRS